VGGYVSWQKYCEDLEAGFAGCSNLVELGAPTTLSFSLIGTAIGYGLERLFKSQGS
jgi:hypothetical protein